MTQNIFDGKNKSVSAEKRIAFYNLIMAYKDTGRECFKLRAYKMLEA